jgi:hypothetical protein
MPFGGQIGVAAAPAVEKKLTFFFFQTFGWLAGIGISSGFDRGLEDHSCSTTQLARSGCRREEKSETNPADARTSSPINRHSLTPCASG